jgi:uncharacterized protein (UPF0335 family)
MSSTQPEQVRHFVQQIETAQTVIDDANTDKSELYKAAKQAGLNVGALRALITERRKMRQNAALFQTQAEMMARYRQYLLAHVHVREAQDDEAASPIAALVPLAG